MNEELRKHFHFTLGPVQSFVSQARRIRDFWAGSFLLSWLSAVAMRSVETQGGTIQFPSYDENYMSWLAGDKKGSPPNGVPNRFVAVVPDKFNGEKVAITVRRAWWELAEKVWENDLAKLLEPQRTKTREIWDRQIKHFWEMSWVLTEGNDDKAMDRRKNWRNHMLPTEQGSLCSLMDGWVELSGEEKPGKAKEFWDSLREKLEQDSDKRGEQPQKNKFGRDLKEREQLCAIAFVKRRFAKVFHKVNINIDGQSYRGWSVQRHRIPSIDDMAAVRWLERVLKNVDEGQLQTIIDATNNLETTEESIHYNRPNPIRCIDQACQGQMSTQKKSISCLDGGVFFEHALRNGRIFIPESIQPMLNILAKLKEKFDKPSPYYAILLMDGDNMGQALSHGDPKEISKALLKFNKATANLVYEYNGFLIYAGGDDVLALLPVEDVLNCAYQLHKAYEEMMKGVSESTLSGAIQFAHVKTPLTLLLQDAHKLLDQVAKKEYGRDSLAVRVWNQGGKGLEWAMPWKWVIDDEKEQPMLDSILTEFRQLDEAGHGQFSKGFFYKIHDFFWQNSELDFEVQKALLVSAYLASGKNVKKNLTRSDAERQVSQLLGQCKRLRRETADQYKEMKPSFNPDGALLVRFLIGKGVVNHDTQQESI